MSRILIAAVTAALLMASPSLSLAAPKPTPTPPAAAPAAATNPAAAPAKPEAAPEAKPGEKPAKPDEAKTGPAAEPAKPATPEPAPAPPPRTFTSAKIWPGGVNMARVTSKPQTWRHMDALLLNDKFKPEAKEEVPTIDRPPADGTHYAILDVQVMSKKSISKYDYVLKTPKGDYPCLAMGWKRGEEDAIFDPRLWEIKYETAMGLVQLIFEMPVGTMEAMLVSALPQALPPPPVELKFIEDAPPAPAEAPAEAPAAAPGAAPAAEPAAAPAAEPAAAPAKEGTEPAAPAPKKAPAPKAAPAAPAAK